ncbi:type I addiction module toxin, SymE family [Klebsiella quasivariicola]|uniref:SymE family type I addiction module toxin n=1 Tax=Klebsiella quasivariicola TaxID=2026240 RepID=UPI00109CB32B|nr:SymE family type I addiction module toxin [Klebsiella quasivariicola]NBZ77172.1 type I addiction module toxin, SymE family [Klebsiella quasivariicola]VGQ14671.1 Toxic protein SymE [Klebsiella quasivariicola]
MTAQHTTATRGIARASRQLTVGYIRKRHEDRKTRETRRYTRHAALSLNGNWLEQAGFPVGTQVRVSVSPGKLVIENLELVPPGTGLPSGQTSAAGEPDSPLG